MNQKIYCPICGKELIKKYDRYEILIESGVLYCPECKCIRGKFEDYYVEN